MSAKDITIKLIWQNNVEFRMTSKEDGIPPPPAVTVLLVEEDGQISTMWGAITSVCITYFQQALARIGEEMKQ